MFDRISRVVGLLRIIACNLCLSMTLCLLVALWSVVTSYSVKDLIVAASGVDDAAWEGTYIKPTGGILTVHSELDDPIHKVAMCGVKLWKEFDGIVFKLVKGKWMPWSAERKAEIIRTEVESLSGRGLGGHFAALQ